MVIWVIFMAFKICIFKKSLCVLKWHPMRSMVGEWVKACGRDLLTPFNQVTLVLSIAFIESPHKI